RSSLLISVYSSSGSSLWVCAVDMPIDSDLRTSAERSDRSACHQLLSTTAPMTRRRAAKGRAAAMASRLFPRMRAAPSSTDGSSSDPRGVEFAWGSDRKSTRLNSSHVSISYAVFCLKKKNKSGTVVLASEFKQTDGR